MTDHDETRHIPSDDELLAARAELERLVGPALLNDPALWAEPSVTFEDSLLTSIERPEMPEAANVAVIGKQSSRRPKWLAPAAAAATVLAIVAVLTLRPANADWEVALGATPEAIGVEASVLGWNEASGTRIELDITGLAAAPDGFVYELWFSDGPVHVSAGTFHNPENVTLWAGVSRRDFPRLWITLEPLDDDPSPGINLLDTEL